MEPPLCSHLLGAKCAQWLPKRRVAPSTGMAQIWLRNAEEPTVTSVPPCDPSCQVVGLMSATMCYRPRTSEMRLALWRSRHQIRETHEGSLRKGHTNNTSQCINPKTPKGTPHTTRGRNLGIPSLPNSHGNSRTGARPRSTLTCTSIPHQKDKNRAATKAKTVHTQGTDYKSSQADRQTDQKSTRAHHPRQSPHLNLDRRHKGAAAASDNHSRCRKLGLRGGSRAGHGLVAAVQAAAAAAAWLPA